MALRFRRAIMQVQIGLIFKVPRALLLDWMPLSLAVWKRVLNIEENPLADPLGLYRKRIDCSRPQAIA